MGDTVSKTRFFIFLSIICLMINLMACCISALNSNTMDINTGQQTDIPISGNIPSNTNITIVAAASMIPTSFVPFVSIVPLQFVGLDNTTTLLVSLIIAIIGTLQLFLIVVIILNMLPFFNA